MGSYNFKRFIQILGGTFVATFIIIGLLRGHYGQIYINVLWEDFGTSLSIVSIIGFCLNKWMWKWSIFHGWLVPFPCLEGEWEGDIFYNWNGTDKEKKIKIKIKQSFLQIQVLIETNESYSNSICASFDFDEMRGHRELIYSYINVPDVTIRERSQIHYGTARLRYKEKDKTLEGTYWTDRKSVGDIILTKLQ